MTAMKSEKEKMLAGELYNAADPVLAQEQKKARALAHRLNCTEYGNQASYREIIDALLPNAAPDITIEPPFYCDYGYNIFAGTKVFFNFNCALLDVMPIKIGANVMFGPNVQIYTATHTTDAETRRQGLEYAKPIRIGDDCWFGGGAIVLPGVTIGDRCVIGAGAVVSRDIPADAVVAGNPARVINPDDPQRASKK